MTLSLLFTEGARRLLVDDMSLACNSSVVELSGNLLSIEQGGGFFESPALGFDDEEVDKDELESDPDTVDDLWFR